MVHGTVWGLDIGSSAIKAVKLARRGQGCEIIDFDVVDIPGCGTDEDTDRVERIQSALAALTSQHQFGHDPVFVGLPGKLCLFREFHLPQGSEGKREDLVRYEARQQIPFPLDQVEWGYEQFEDDQGIGIELVAVRKTILQEMLTLTDKFKLNVRGVTGSPMALFNYIHHEFQPGETTLVLDAGFHGTDFVVMNGRQVYFRTIQIAGRELTRVLEDKFQVPYEKGEELKKNISRLPQKEKMLKVITPTLRQLGAEIQRTVGFYRSRSRGRKIAKVYLVGHTFRLPGMVDQLNEQIREAPFFVVEGVQRIRVGRGVNQSAFNNEFNTLAVALGLGLQGLGLGELKLDLLPKERIGADLLAQKKWWAVGCVAALALTFGLSYFADAAKLKSNQGAQKKVEDVAVLIKNANKNLRKAVTGLDLKAKRVRRLARLARDRGRILHVLDALFALDDETGKPFFGPENKAYLTNLYVSRMPFDSGVALCTAKASSRRNRLLGRSRVLKEEIYKPLVGAAELENLPPELRPDLPLVVVVSGELEKSESGSEGARNKLQRLVRMLDKLDEVPAGPNGEKRLYYEDYAEDGEVYEELVPWYTYNGEVPVPAPSTGMADGATSAAGGSLPPNIAAKIEHKTLSFNIVFCWEEPDDRDLTVAEAAKLAKVGTATPKKKHGARGRGRKKKKRGR